MRTAAIALALLPTTLVRIPSCCPCCHVVTVEESFEQGLTDWTQGSDVPEDPNNPGHPVAWSIELSDEQASDGQFSARFFLDGRQDDGTIWLVRSIEIPACPAFNVDLTFDFWSPSESFNTIAKVSSYAGHRPPSKESHFDTTEPANQVAGFQEYNYSLHTIRRIPLSKLYVAFGISAVWETEMTYFIDNVHIEVTPDCPE
jgi:hypothetical protein